MRRRNKRHILIGIPTANTKVHVTVAAFAVEAARQNTLRDCPYKFSVAYLVGKSPTEFARNHMVTFVIDNPKIDALWFVDSDMAPSPNSFELLNVDADIVAGVAPIFSSSANDAPSFTYNIYKRVDDKDCVGRDFLPIYTNGHKGAIEVDGAGTACMIIKRHVLEDKRLWLGDRINGTVPFFRWPRAITGETLGTDDLDFCRRARELGYTIKVLPSVTWGHFKEVDLLWIINRFNSATERHPQSISTINEWNTIAMSNNPDQPQFFYTQNTPLPKPSSEATLNPESER
jgi:hypothetical protein